MQSILSIGALGTRPFEILSNCDVDHARPTCFNGAEGDSSMDWAHCIVMARILRMDEAIDAATFLALRELRERLERSPK